MPSTSAKKRLRRVSLCFAATFLAIVVLEGILQVGALVVHLTQARPTLPTRGHSDCVLCVGDSWTQGMGSSDYLHNSYPAVLQQLLQKETGKPWQVVNGGESGQNSREVLLRLRSHLESSRPQYVIVLVGRNDIWSKPELVDDDDANVRDGEFRFRWRVPRLVRWALGAREDRASNETMRGPDWEPKILPWPNAHPDEPGARRDHPEASALRSRGWQHLWAGQLAEATAVMHSCLQLVPDDDEAHCVLVEVALKRGNMADMQAHQQWLVERWKETKNYWVGRNAVGACESAGQYAAGRRCAAQFLEKWPDEGAVWAQRAFCEYQLNELDAAMSSVTQAERFYPGEYTFMVRTKVEGQLRNFAAMIDAVYRCYLHNNNWKWVQNSLAEFVTWPGLDSLLQARVDALTAPEGVKQRLTEIVRQCIAAKDAASVRDVLGRHYAAIVADCAKSGAVPVLLNYPVSTPFGSFAMEFAQSAKIAHIDLEKTFAERVGAQRLAELRSTDGHVVDEGYRLMAQFICEGLLEILRKRN
jgi:lysophospholipase L1-like esterase